MSDLRRGETRTSKNLLNLSNGTLTALIQHGVSTSDYVSMNTIHDG